MSRFIGSYRNHSLLADGGGGPDELIVFFAADQRIFLFHCCVLTVLTVFYF